MNDHPIKRLDEEAKGNKKQEELYVNYKDNLAVYLTVRLPTLLSRQHSQVPAMFKWVFNDVINDT